MKLLIIGSRDFAQTVAALTRNCGHEPCGFVDDFNTGDGIVGSCNSILRSHPPAVYGVAIAIGYKQLPARWKAWQRLQQAGYAAPALIHPRAYVAADVRIGAGSMVMAGALVDTRAELGEIVVAWPAACINHDAVMGANTFVSPNATVCGHARVGHSCFLGAASAIVDHALMPDGTFLPMSERWTARDPEAGR
jgi:UDP-3-O-[3-hydroxymyristoyl] glucosamine N-acyltransferase